MKKLLLLAAMLLQHISFAQTYCSSGSSNASQMYIKQIKIKGDPIITNNSIFNSIGYEDYTNLITKIYRGDEIHPNYIEVASQYSAITAALPSAKISIWIDLNHNGQFDTNEKMQEALISYDPTSNGQNAGESINFDLPYTAPLGITRMRIKLTAQAIANSNNPCGIDDVSETEDYTVNIINCSQAETFFTQFATSQLPIYLNFSQSGNLLLTTLTDYEELGIQTGNVINSSANDSWPQGICGNQQYTWVAEYTRNRVIKIDNNTGVTVQVLTGLTQPRGLTYDPSSQELYVLDAGSGRVVVYNNDSVIVRSFGNIGAFVLGLPSELSILADSAYISDYNNNAIRVYNKNTGEFVREIGKGILNQPRGLTIFNNIIYVADAANNRIAKFNLDGGFIGSFDGDNQGGGKLSYPMSVKINEANGEIFVSDYNNYKIQVFKIQNCGSSQRQGTQQNIISETEAMGVFPNPANDNFTVSFNESVTRDIVIYNSLGEEVLRKTGSGMEMNISDPSLTNGLYTIHATSNGVVNKTKVVIAK